MRITTLLLTFFTVLTMNAQLVTISNTHQIPQIGDTVMYQDANTFGFDAEGTGTVTDKLWDFGSLMDDGNEDILFWWLDTTGLDGASNFPNATIARGGTTENGHFFYNNTANDLNRIGWYESPSNYGIYHNSFATEFTFPFTASDNNSTDYSGEFSPLGAGEDSTMIEQGNISLQADMQGTLILPTGEFHDVLRIHDVESFHIKAYIVGTPVTDNVIEDDYYYWFVDTIFQPILIYGTTSIDGDQQSEVLRYQPIETNTTSVSYKVDNSNINVFPNPSNGVFEINGSGINSIKILDIKGQTVNIEISSFNKVDLTSQDKGIYFLKINTDKGVVMRKLVVE